MSGRPLPTLVVAAVALGLATASPASADEAAAVGFSNNSVVEKAVSAAESAALLADAGAEIDRVHVDWKQLEPTPGAPLRFSRWDEIYLADLARGVKPLFVLALVPEWAAEPNACDGVEGTCHAAPAPEYYDDFGRIAAKVAERYPLAVGIEIWNEPNHPHFWRPSPDPQAYADLLEASYEAIKAVAPSMPVAGGAVAGGVGSRTTGKIGARDFIGALLLEGGAAHMDAVSAHPYVDPALGDPALATSLVDDIHLVFDYVGAELEPIWLTETGASTSGPAAISEAEQAIRVLELQSALRAAPGVEMVLFHTLVEPYRPPDSAELGYGLVTRGLRRKPAYCALAFAWGKPDACGPSAPDPAFISTATAHAPTPRGATLRAELDANATATDYAFDYGTSATYGSRTKAAAGGAAGEPITVGSTVTGVTPSTTYHFRAVALRDGIVVARGKDRTFTTAETPRLSVADLGTAEGTGRRTGAAVTVAIQSPATDPVSFSYATASGTATEPADYAPTSGTATIPVGQAATTISIPVIGDTAHEPDEDLELSIGTPANAAIADARGRVEIADDDPPPALSIGDLKVSEGDGQTRAAITVTAANPSSVAASFDFATADGTATQPADYAKASGTMTIPAGETTATIEVALNGDEIDEADEAFRIGISAAVNATIADGGSIATIVDDEATLPIPPSTPAAGGKRDWAPPETVIHSGPKKNVKSKKAAFAFRASEPARFECSIDDEDFAPCGPRTTFRVDRGRHMLQVRAIDAAGNADPTPAVNRWRLSWIARSATAT